MNFVNSRSFTKNNITVNNYWIFLYLYLLLYIENHVYNIYNHRINLHTLINNINLGNYGKGNKQGCDICISFV